MKEIAEKFGKSLDNDDFEATKETLSENCKYIIGNEVLTGPEKITVRNISLFANRVAETTNVFNSEKKQIVL